MAGGARGPQNGDRLGFWWAHGFLSRIKFEKIPKNISIYHLHTHTHTHVRERETERSQKGKEEHKSPKLEGHVAQNKNVHL